MKLSPHDISYIRLCLRNKNLGYRPLQDELVDHIICEVEEQVDKGVPFKQAVDSILDQVDYSTFNTLQNETIHSDNYSTKIMMHNTGKILFRNLVNHKKYTFINLVGLATAFTCVMAIALYVIH